MNRRPRGLSQHELVEWCLTENSAWDGQCMVWLGSRNSKGYANIRTGDRTVLVARLILAEQLGVSLNELPSATHALHSCDRGHEGCVTPEHIRPGSRGDNMRESVERGRHVGMSRSHCPRGHALVEGNLVPSALRRGHRSCLRCSRARSTAVNYRKRGLEISVEQALELQGAQLS